MTDFQIALIITGVLIVLMFLSVILDDLGVIEIDDVIELIKCIGLLVVIVLFMFGIVYMIVSVVRNWDDIIEILMIGGKNQ